VTVVPDTQEANFTSVVLKLSQVMSARAHWMIVGSIYVIFFARVAINAYVVALPRMVLARIVLRIKMNQSTSVSTIVCAPDAAIDTLAHTQSVNVPPA